MTVALSIGWLLTVANTGDSATVLDTGCSILELTRSHRIHSNMEEQARLKQASQHLAPLGFHLQGPAKPGEPGVGPLRLWPGGLCVSRSIGDLDAGPEVVPVPHIRQVRSQRVYATGVLHMEASGRELDCMGWLIMGRTSSSVAMKALRAQLFAKGGFVSHQPMQSSAPCSILLDLQSLQPPPSHSV